MRQRSSDLKSFKTQVVQERLQPGATISSVSSVSSARTVDAVSNLIPASVKCEFVLDACVTDTRSLEQLRAAVM